MKFIAIALLASVQAVKLQDRDVPAFARSYNSYGDLMNQSFAANNDDILDEGFERDTRQFVQIDGPVEPWKEARQGAPEANKCANDNKATGDLEDCSTPGNSAWNTITTARTGDPRKALDAPYPGHTLH